MKFTLDWLQEYVNTDGISASAIADHLTMLGLEVDAVTEVFSELAPLRTAKIISASALPDSDHLQVCEVAVGSETMQIVCGAPNARKDLVTAVALPGAVLPGGMKIKASKVRGVPSSGMLCSERELGLSTDHAGIMELPRDTPHGLPFVQAAGLPDTMIEVDLTPNRPDCASVIGIAREIAGITGRSLSLPVQDAAVTAASTEFSVTVESSELCPRYAARLIKGVTIGPSPLWLRARLLAIGQRPINSIVDITNYVMMEYGQPLHAFDFKKLSGGRIVVRTPKADETTFTTLDGTERKLDADMLMICDGERPVAVAGIMGGMNSEVSDETTDILLESACFNPVSIRKTARRLNLATEASYRFERGVDPNGAINAMDRAATLFCTIAGGSCSPEGADVYDGCRPALPLTLRVSRTSELIGMPLDAGRIIALLESIGIICSQTSEDILTVTPPSFRVDIEREADLVEEVARLIGYNSIPTSLPQVDLSYPEQDTARLKRQEACRILTSIGFNEAINYSFTAEDHLEKLELAPDDPRRKVVRLLNPLSEEQAVMRTMLLPGLLENVKRNISFQKTDIRLFEVGKVFTPTGINQQPMEMMRLAGVLAGDLHGNRSPLYFKSQPVDIFDAKGAVESLLDELRLLDPSLQQPLTFRVPTANEQENFYIPRQTLLLVQGSQILGILGKIRKETLKRFGIKHDVYSFDLDFEALSALSAAKKAFAALPVYPAVRRDIALLLPVHVSAGELLKVVAESNEKLIEHYDIFDIYTGEPIKEGYKSVAMSITYRSPSKTLTEKNVEKSHQKIVAMLTSRFEGSFREA
ncbi:MAG: phenylalanine--tRNA ligase subunit beta [Desulfocapsaceae bacterium]|nr:phenylalanine--tRNA ligase subunit beta [Desulfocapsaceae bacterium]